MRRRLLISAVLSACGADRGSPQPPPTSSAFHLAREAPAPIAPGAPDAAAEPGDAGQPEAAPEPEPRFHTLPTDSWHPAWMHPPKHRAAGAPLVVFLHGMCALPAWECPVFIGASESAWLLCPRGPARCSGDGAMWLGTTQKLQSQVAQATAAMLSADPKGFDEERRALIGYSLGAPAALRIASAEPGKWRRLMIVNAKLTANAAQLDKAGVQRVVLVAGERDQTLPALAQSERNLTRSGLDVRFFRLARTGHFFDAESAERMKAALAYLLEGWE